MANNTDVTGNQPPTPPGKTSATPPPDGMNWPQIRLELAALIARILQLLTVRPPLPAGTTQATDKRFGTDNHEAAMAAAVVLDDCKDAFPRFPVDGPGLRNEEERARELKVCTDQLQALTDQVGGEAGRVESEMEVHTGQVVDTVAAKKLDPNTDPALLGRLETSAKPLDGIAARRTDARKKSLKKNKNVKAEVAGAQDETAQQRADNSDLQVENKYLRGEQITPEDVKAARDVAVPAAPGQQRTTRRGRSKTKGQAGTAAPPKAGSRGKASPRGPGKTLH